MTHVELTEIAERIIDKYFGEHDADDGDREGACNAAVKELVESPAPVAAYVAVRLGQEVLRHRAELSDAFPLAALKRRLAEHIK